MLRHEVVDGVANTWLEPKEGEAFWIERQDQPNIVVGRIILAGMNAGIARRIVDGETELLDEYILDGKVKPATQNFHAFVRLVETNPHVPNGETKSIVGISHFSEIPLQQDIAA
jgi:hypothetical protein